jgi:LmbE family N-acetylglucosaminyl deacetylase
MRAANAIAEKNKMTEELPGVWTERQKILVILAHPDDPEFFCGATLARWASAGHWIDYFLITCGDKGANDPQVDPKSLCEERHKEQRAAADIIGVKKVNFMELPDGYLEPSISLRKDIVRIIRTQRPDVLVTCDPQNLYPSATYGVNHPDHRYAGQVVLDAVFPAAGNPLFFPELIQEGLEPWVPREVWVSIPAAANVNVTLDVTDTWEVKISALKEHKSQIGDPAKLDERIRSRRTPDSTDENPRYEEKFHLIKLK